MNADGLQQWIINSKGVVGERINEFKLQNKMWKKSEWIEKKRQRKSWLDGVAEILKEEEV